MHVVQSTVLLQSDHLSVSDVDVLWAYRLY